MSGVAADLLQTLPAALLVCVLPGYFWAAALFGTRGFIERLAYSVAISITLVPSAALLQTSLLGGGVSLGVAIVSALAVFATGLAAWLKFGSAPNTDILPTGRASGNTVPDRRRSLMESHRRGRSTFMNSAVGIPALILLALAFGLVLASNFGGESPSAYFLATATLILFAAAANLLGARRNLPPDAEPDGTDAPPTASSRLGAVVFSAAALLVFSLTALRGYLGPVSRDWPYLRGGDQYNHAVMANSMLSEGGYYDSYLAYPSGFATLTAAVSRLSGVEPLDIFPALAPALILLPTLACYALGHLLGGKWCGLAAALFAGLLLSGTYENIVAARYPNLVSAQFLLVLTVAALVRLYYSPSIRSGLLLSILGSSVVLYHSVASLYLAIMLAIISTLFLPYLFLTHHRREALALFSSLVLLGALSVIYAWDTYDLPTLVAGLLGGSETGAGGRGLAIAIGTQPPLSLPHLIEATSQPVLWLGFFGSLLFLFGLGSRTIPQILTRATLLIWAILLFAGSRTALSGFPQRFERDLGMPLAILAALALAAILGSLGLRSQPMKSVAAATVALLIASSLAIQASQNLETAAEPSTTITPEAAEAGEWLGENNDGGNIISTPFLSPGISNRAILALGGYTGLQSYPERRVRTPRSLPPSGRETIEASFWTISHPEGERTKEILERYDIRYLVFAKGYAGADWQGFDERDELYRKEFVNESVVVFSPRSLRSGE